VKNKLFLFLIFCGILNADIINEYKNNEFNKICNFKNIVQIRNEKLLSIVGISCVKTDNLYLLPYIIAKLKYTKSARQNAIYLSIIYLQKRLLYAYFFDNFSLEGFNLPNTNYILSIIFNKIKNGQYKKQGNKIIIKFKKELIEIYPQNNKLIVNEYYKNKLIKRHWFR